jgi:excisionase family DNA binding protein
MGDLLTTSQLAERLQVSKDTILGWARSGVIPEIRISAKVRRFSLDDVVKAIRERAATPKAASGAPAPQERAPACT